MEFSVKVWVGWRARGRGRSTVTGQEYHAKLFNKSITYEAFATTLSFKRRNIVTRDFMRRIGVLGHGVATWTIFARKSPPPSKCWHFAVRVELPQLNNCQVCERPNGDVQLCTSCLTLAVRSWQEPSLRVSPSREQRAHGSLIGADVCINKTAYLARGLGNIGRSG